MTISYTSEGEGYLNYYRAKEEIPVGIKLSDEQIEKADATVVHVLREIGKKMWREGSVMCISEKDWQAIIAEAGLVELTGIRIEIDTNLKPGEGHLKPTCKGIYSDEVERELDTYIPM